MFLSRGMLQYVSLIVYIVCCLKCFHKLDLILMSDARNGSFPFSPYRIFHFLHQTISKMLCLKNVKMIRSVQNKLCLFLLDNR